MAGAFRYFSWISIQLEPVLFDGVVPVSKKILVFPDELTAVFILWDHVAGAGSAGTLFIPHYGNAAVLAAFFSSDRMKSQSNENREQKVVFLGRKIYNKAIG